MIILKLEYHFKCMSMLCVTGMFCKVGKFDTNILNTRYSQVYCMQETFIKDFFLQIMASSTQLGSSSRIRLVILYL